MIEKCLDNAVVRPKFSRFFYFLEAVGPPPPTRTKVLVILGCTPLAGTKGAAQDTAAEEAGGAAAHL